MDWNFFPGRDLAVSNFVVWGLISFLPIIGALIWGSGLKRKIKFGYSFIAWKILHKTGISLPPVLRNVSNEKVIRSLLTGKGSNAGGWKIFLGRFSGLSWQERSLGLQNAMHNSQLANEAWNLWLEYCPEAPEKVQIEVLKAGLENQVIAYQVWRFLTRQMVHSQTEKILPVRLRKNYRNERSFSGKTTMTSEMVLTYRPEFWRVEREVCSHALVHPVAGSQAWGFINQNWGKISFLTKKCVNPDLLKKALMGSSSTARSAWRFLWQRQDQLPPGLFNAGMAAGICSNIPHIARLAWRQLGDGLDMYPAEKLGVFLEIRSMKGDLGGLAENLRKMVTDIRALEIKFHSCSTVGCKIFVSNPSEEQLEWLDIYNELFQVSFQRYDWHGSRGGGINIMLPPARSAELLTKILAGWQNTGFLTAENPGYFSKGLGKKNTRLPGIELQPAFAHNFFQTDTRLQMDAKLAILLLSALYPYKRKFKTTGVSPHVDTYHLAVEGGGVLRDLQGRYLRGQPRYNRLDLIQVAWMLPQDSGGDRPYFGMILRSFQLLLELAKVEENSVNPAILQLRNGFFEQARTMFDAHGLSGLYKESWQRSYWPRNALLLNRLEDLRWKNDAQWMRKAAEMVGNGLKIANGVIQVRRPVHSDSDPRKQFRKSWYEKIASFKTHFNKEVDAWLKKDLEKALSTIDDMLLHASVLERAALLLSCYYEVPLEDLVSWILEKGNVFPQLSTDQMVKELMEFVKYYDEDFSNLDWRLLCDYFQLHSEIASLTSGSL